MLTPQSDAGCAGIARARRRGLLGKFGGRGGVRWRAGTQSRGARGVWEAWEELPAIGRDTQSREKKEFFREGYIHASIQIGMLICVILVSSVAHAGSSPIILQDCRPQTCRGPVVKVVR